MFGFYLLGGRGRLLDTLLVLLLLTLTTALVRTRWRAGERSPASAIALACGGGFLFTLVSWWLAEEPVRSILLFTPLFALAGLLLADLIPARRIRPLTVLVILGTLNWIPIPLMLSCGPFFPETVTEQASGQSPDGRFRAVVLQHQSPMDAAYDTVVLRPPTPWRNPTAWPQKTVLTLTEGSSVASVNWEGPGRLVIGLPLEATVAEHVKSSHHVTVELRRVR